MSLPVSYLILDFGQTPSFLQLFLHDINIQRANESDNNNFHAMTLPRHYEQLNLGLVDHMANLEGLSESVLTLCLFLFESASY